MLYIICIHFHTMRVSHYPGHFGLDTSVKYNHVVAKDLCVAYRIHGKALRM